MKKFKKLFNEFKQFAIKGDAFSLAIGVIIGASFKGVIDSLVNDIIMPPISYITSKVNYTNLFITLGRKQYDSIGAAKEAGAVVIQYGNFINQLIIFLITSLVIFFFIFKFQQMLTKKEKQDKKEKTTKKCKYCLGEIPFKATRCPYCTSTV